MVSKHVSLVYEFKRQCDTRLLLETSQVEQDLACTQDHNAAKEVCTSHDTAQLLGTDLLWHRPLSICYTTHVYPEVMYSG